MAADCRRLDAEPRLGDRAVLKSGKGSAWRPPSLDVQRGSRDCLPPLQLTTPGANGALPSQAALAESIPCAQLFRPSFVREPLVYAQARKETDSKKKYAPGENHVAGSCGSKPTWVASRESLSWSTR